MENNISGSIVSMITIGEKLKKTRENKSLTVEQVRKQTRIHTEVLLALESGRCDEILNSTYVKSFLKKYASFLGLDAGQIMKEYILTRQDRFGDSRAESRQRVDHGIDTGKQARLESDIISRFIIITGILFFAVAVIFFVVFLGKMIVPALSRSAPAHTVISQAKRPIPKRASASTQKKSIPAATAVSKAAATRKNPLYLVLKVKKPVLIKVKKDGVYLFERVMPKDSLESFRANEKIELYVAKAESIELTLNGKSLGSPGRGLIKNLEITNKGIRIK